MNFSEETLERRPRRFSDLLLPPQKLATTLHLNPESPGSVLSPPTPGSASANKPPIFSSPDVKNSAFKFSLKQKSESSLVSRDTNKSDSYHSLSGTPNSDSSFTSVVCKVCFTKLLNFKLNQEG